MKILRILSKQIKIGQLKTEIMSVLTSGSCQILTLSQYIQIRLCLFCYLISLLRKAFRFFVVSYKYKFVVYRISSLNFFLIKVVYMAFKLKLFIKIQSNINQVV